MRIVSWNVNGIRAAERKGFFDWLAESEADIVCIQETKAQEEQLGTAFLNPEAYSSYFFSAEKKGYSGVALYTQIEPLSIKTMEEEDFDAEGRTLIADFGSFVLFNCYFPNSQEEGKRLDYKLAFNRCLKERADALVKEGRNVVICGDFNVAHKPIDLARPQANEKNPGYLPEEREWMSTFLGGGYTDTFRAFHKEPEQYSWWSYRAGARARNVGWRLDYFCVNDGFMPQVKDSLIHQEVMGSDHCPVVLLLKGDLEPYVCACLHLCSSLRSVFGPWSGSGGFHRRGILNLSAE